MNKVIVGFVVWTVVVFASGFSTADLIKMQSAKMQTKYKVGDCLSNGLYFERITEIRKGTVIKEAKYVMLPTIQGHLSAPDTTAAWIVDEGHVLVNERNCK